MCFGVVTRGMLWWPRVQCVGVCWNGDGGAQELPPQGCGALPGQHPPISKFNIMISCDNSMW